MSKKITGEILNPDNSIDLENKEISVSTGIDYYEEEKVYEGKEIIAKEKPVKGNLSIIGNTYQDLTPILPEEYTQLEYIEGTGKQYIDTGYLPKDTSKYELLGTIVDVPTSVRPVTYLFGENDEDDENTPEEQLYYSCYIKVNRLGKIEFEFGRDEYGNTLTLPPVSGYIGNKHKFILNKETAYIDNTLIGNFSKTTLPFSKQKSLYLFALHYTDLGRVESAEIGPTTIQINNFKIYEGDSLKHNFIPCKRNSDNELGLYDYVTKAFKTNAGTGTFNAGPVSTLPNEDYQIPSIDYPSDVRACGDNINISPTNINDWEQGTINVNTGGNDKSTTRIRTINYCNIDNINEDYYISLEDENYVFVNIAMFNEDDSFIGPYNTMVDTKINGAKELKVNFSTTNTKKIKVIVRRKDNSNIMPNEIINIKPKLTKSSVKTPWSPYGMGSMEISKSNKNILNSKLMIGIANINFIDIKVKPNTKWTFSSNIPKTYDGSNAFIFATTKKHNYTTAGNGVWEGQKRTITADEEGYISLGYRKDSNINSFDDYWYQIEEGEVATTPIPHESENYVVSTQEPFYEGDTLVKINGVRYEKHNYEKYIVTSEGNWKQSSIVTEGYNNFYIDGLTFYKDNPESYCNYFKRGLFSNWINKTLDTFYHITVKSIGFRFKSEIAPTLEDFKQLLNEKYNSGNPVYVVYKLGEPKLIPCTEDQNAVLDELDNLFLYDGTTYISSGDEIKADLKLTIKDEVIPMGNYIIPKPDNEEVKDKSKFTGYDYMIKFDVPFVDNNTYPIRADDYLENLCNYVGVKLGSKEFVNNDYMILGNPFTNGESCRIPLSNIAQLAGGFAHIGVDNALYIESLIQDEKIEDVIDGNNYMNFDSNNLFGPVNSFKIQMNSGVDGEESVREEEGLTDETRCQISISDNYFLNSADEREKVIDNLYNNIKGLLYLPLKTSYYGYPWLRSGKKIKVLNIKDEEFYTYVFNHKFTYNGGYEGEIEIKALTKTQSIYKDTLTLSKWRRNTELKVNKIDGNINSVISETNENTSKIIEMQQDLSGFSFEMQNAGGVNLIKNSTGDNGLSNTTGEVTLEKNLDISNATISKSAIKINTGSITTDEIYINDNEDYTYSCLILKNELTNVKVTINSDKTEVYELECEPNKFQKFSFLINSSVNKVTIKVEADNNYCMISDRMLNKGNTALTWQPYTGEIITKNVKINDEGISVKSSLTNSRFIINSEEAKVVNKNTEEVQVTFNGDKTILKRALVEEESTVGKLRSTVLENEDVMLTFDD